ncbi:hypothetical protein ACFVIM_30715 [Streptomyces sp. NPDC057638]|uniref:hypothetical protein n=1 Tax=Streptomyces sp. NPDC057638 TaxID=3346190 RepID=UPI00368D24EF
MLHQPHVNGPCAACVATGLPAVAARDLKVGMLIQDAFTPGPYSEYSVGEIGAVEVDESEYLPVQWSFRWHRVYRGTELIYAYPDSSFSTHVVMGDHEYLPLDPGSAEPPTEKYKNPTYP